MADRRVSLKTSLTLITAIAFINLSCYHKNEPVTEKRQPTHLFLTGTWDRKTDQKPAMVNVFTDNGQMRAYRGGKLTESLWYRLDSSAEENVIIFSDNKITKTSRAVLDTSHEVFGMLMRTKGNDTLLLQIPILTFSRRIPREWDEDLPSNVYVLIRRK